MGHLRISSLVHWKAMEKICVACETLSTGQIQAGELPPKGAVLASVPIFGGDLVFSC